MPLAQIVDFVRAGHWLPLILFLTLIARKWTSPESRFPVTFPVTWRPTITALGGLVYGFVSSLENKVPMSTAVLTLAATAGTSGFLDGVLTAIFNQDNAPVWARTIVCIVDDLTGATPVSGAAKERVLRSLRPGMLPAPSVKIGSKYPSGLPAAEAAIVSPPRSVPPSALEPSISPKGATGSGLAILLMTMMLATGHIACTPGPVPPNTPVDVENAIGCVTKALLTSQPLTACITKYGPALIADAVQILVHSSFGAMHPELTPRMHLELEGLKGPPAK